MAKRDPDYRYDEDDFLVLGQLASSIADMYESMHENDSSDTQAQDFALLWHDISRRHLSRVTLDAELRQQRERSFRNVSRVLSL